MTTMQISQQRVQFFFSPLLRRSGHLTFEQLARLRHRGAFSAVAQTFSDVCRIAHNSGSPDDQELIADLYDVSRKVHLVLHR